MYDNLAKADHSFERVGRESLDRELIAVRLELFALAGCHHAGSDVTKITQIRFMREFLDENGYSEIFAAMSPYNRAVAESATATASGTRALRARVTFLNMYRQKFYARYAQQLWDAGIRDKGLYQDIAHVANLEHTHGAWRRTLTHRYVATEFANRLGCSPNADAATALQTFVHGMYNGAALAIKEVKVVGGDPSFPQ